MQISDLTQQYMSKTTGAEASTGARGVESLVSAVRSLTAGNIFEGTVNSIKGNQVTLALSNGMELGARLEANMQLVQGQSMFFQVKSNDGATLAIRPYTVDGAGANLTLLNALNAAGLPVQDKFLNMANTMMQEQMPIDKNSMSQMARILMANPDMGVQTLVQMRKLNLPITPEMVTQFENYADDKSTVHKAIDQLITELPATLAGKDMPFETLKNFDSRLLMLLTEDLTGEQIKSEGQIQNGQMDASQIAGTTMESGAAAQMGEVAQTAEAVAQEAQLNESEAVGQSNSNQTNVLKLLHNLFGDIGASEADSPASLLQKLAFHIQNGNNVSKEALQNLFASKDMQTLLRDVLEEQFYLEPKDIEKGDKLQKLFQNLNTKAQNLEALLQNAGLKDIPLTQTLGEVQANIEFMNQINQAYTYAQLPLHMSNQNASGQLYVYTSKRDLGDPERDLTAFLHLNLWSIWVRRMCLCVCTARRSAPSSIWRRMRPMNL